MAYSNIKGITIKLAADMSELNTALKNANDSIFKTQNALKQVEQALKLDPHNIDLLKEKEGLLNKQIEDTQTYINGVKEAMSQIDPSKSDDEARHYAQLNAELVKSESNLKSLNNQLKEVSSQTSSIGQLASKFEQVGNKVSAVGEKLKGVSLAAGAVAGALTGIAVKSAKTADDINTLSKQYGIGTDQLQLYAQASDLVDVSVEAIAKSQAKMKKSMLSAQQGSKNATEAFDKLGVSVTNSDGSLRDQDDVFQEVIESLGSMTNETERDAYAMSIFGKSAAQLNPMIEDMGQTYKTVAETFENNGIEIVDQETLDQANRFNDAIDTIKANVSQALFNLGTNLSATLAPAMEKVSELIGDIAGKIANANPTFLAVVTVVAGIVASLAPVLIIGGKLIRGVGKAIKSFQTLFAVISANPIMAAVVGASLLVSGLIALYKNSENFRNIVNKVGSALKSFITTIASVAKKITTTLASAFNKVKDIGSNIVKGLWDGINNKFAWIVGKIKSFTNGIKDKLKSFFGIASPSKWARDMLGANLVKGFAQGITQNASIINDAVKSLSPTINATTYGGAMAASAGGGVVNNFGDITIDAKSLEDVMTVQDFVNRLTRAKAYV